MMSDKKSLGRKIAKSKSKSKKDAKTIEIDSDDDENPLLDKLPLESVVKVFASLCSPDYERPWQMKNREDVSGSGFVIQGKRILTNAHCIEHAAFITVRKYGFSEKAAVVCISYDCDLAVLEVIDCEAAEAFWKDLKPLQLTNCIPHLQDEVLVAGYPVGGDNISVTRGIVSRIEPIEYTENEEVKLLAVQIDAAVNSGNSGGPCFKDNKVIGIAFQGLDDADGISYIIPMTIVHHFLTEFEEKGSFGGFCSLGLQIQFMENKQLRRAYKMPKGTSGILIRHIDPVSAAHGLVKPGDVLLAIDDVKISNDGSVKFRKRELIDYQHLVTQKFPGTTCKLSVLRDGTPTEIEVKLGHIPEFIPATSAAPALYISWGGLVFVPMSLPFLVEAFGDELEDAPQSLIGEVSRAKRAFAVWRMLDNVLTYQNQQLVVLGCVLVDEINYGYEDEEGRILKKLNGEEIINLNHLLKLLQGIQTGVATFEFDEDVVIVFDVEEVNKKNNQILKANKIPVMTNIPI